MSKSIELKTYSEEEILVLKTELEQKQEYRKLLQSFDNMPDGMIYSTVRDLSIGMYRFDYVSGMCEKLLGLTVSEALADIKNFFRHIHPEDYEKIRQMINDTLHPLRNFDVELRYHHPVTKKEQWLQITSYFRSEGNVVYSDGFIFDITERKQEELNLIIEKERLEKMGNSIPGCTLHQFVRDTRTHRMRMSYVSATWEAVTGIPAEIALTDISKVFSIIPADEFPVMLQAIDHSARTMTDINMDLHFGDRWMRIISRPSCEGKQVIWNGIITDVTEFKRNEIELNKYRENLEQLVQERTRELNDTIEDLRSSNKEIEKYKTLLEDMVAQKVKELELSHKSMRAVLDNIDVHIFVTDFEDYKILFANKQAKELFGDVTGKTCWKVLQKDLTAPCDFCPKKHLLDDQNRPTGIYTWVQKNFINNEWYTCRDAAVEWIDGRMVHIEYSVNISEIKKNENELISYRENLEHIIQERTLELDAALEEIRATNEELHTINNELFNKNDQLADEVIARNEMMKQLEESENKLRNFFAQSFEGIVITDNEGMIIEWNHEQERVTGVSRKEAIGQPCWEVYTKFVNNAENSDELLEKFPKIVNPIFEPSPDGMKRIDETEFRICLPGEEVQYFVVISFQIIHDNKYSLGQIVRDITRQKLIDKELEVYRASLENMVDQRTKELMFAKEKAEESDRLKSAFLANMSHEIRTPLNGIVGFLQFIDSDNISPERRHEYINIVNSSSSQLVKIIDDILDVSKIEANQMNINPIPVNLNDMMNELWVFYTTHLQSKEKHHVELILDDSGFVDNCMVYMDAIRLSQIFSNLIGNAVKFTEKGYIRFGYRNSAPDLLEFVVEDSGIGMRDDQQKIIFERFRQVEIDNRQQYGGTGLGLTISKSLVEMKGGKMWVESYEGKGSTFYFTIPYLPVSQHDMIFFTEIQDHNPSDQKPVTNQSILFVEPVAMKYKYYQKLISAMGASVINAKNLKQWYDLMKTELKFDLVFAEASLFDHEDFNNIIRIKDLRPNLPIVLVVSDLNREKYLRLVRNDICNTAIEVPLFYSDFQKILEKYGK